MRNPSTITKSDSPVYGVIELLSERGYETTNRHGQRVPEPDHCAVGILKPRQFQIGFGRFKFGIRQRGLYLGILWLDDESRGARPDKEWVLDVYGRENIPESQRLAEELRRPYDVKIQVRLDGENPRDEYVFADCDV